MREKKSIGIIGLGIISGHYFSGITQSDELELCAVCDLSETATSKQLYTKYPFYKDYKEMIRQEQLDYVVIATPPDTHSTIAAYALTHDVHVIVEKPATVDLESYLSLLETARLHRKNFMVMFHWQYGSEVLEFNRRYDSKKITAIETTVLDPYSQNGTILPNKRNLQGAWLDSGSNALSLSSVWLPFESVRLESLQKVLCTETNLPLYVQAGLEISGVPVCITVDWRTQENRKETFVEYEGRRIHIDHSNQCIVDGNTRIDCKKMERLPQHYYGFFKHFDGKSDHDVSLEIHRVLFEVGRQI